jgi:hypothetical protein
VPRTSSTSVADPLEPLHGLRWRGDRDEVADEFRDLEADGPDVAQFPAVQHGDAGTAPALVLDQPLELQAVEDLPDRGPADAELRGQAPPP